MRYWLSIIAVLLAINPAYGADFTAQNPDAFILAPNEVFRQLGNFGSEICKEPKSYPCTTMPYGDYEGMKGVIDTSEAVIKESSSTNIYPILMENGERYYLNVFQGPQNPIDYKHDAVIRLSDYENGAKHVGQPLVPNSTVSIVRYSHGSIPSYYTSANPSNSIFAKNLDAVRLILNRQSSRENDEEIVKLLLDCHIQYDKFEQIVRIEQARYMFRDNGKKNLTPFVSLHLRIGSDRAQLLQKIMYSGSSWLFVKGYTILAAGERYEAGPVEFKRDNGSGKVWEWQTSEVDAQKRHILEAIITDPGSAVRYSGRQYFKDHDYIPAEKDSLSRMLRLWDLTQAK